MWGTQGHVRGYCWSGSSHTGSREERQAGWPFCCPLTAWQPQAGDTHQAGRGGVRAGSLASSSAGERKKKDLQGMSEA